MSATRLAVNNKELPAGVGGGGGEVVVGGGDSTSTSNTTRGGSNTASGEGRTHERNSADLLASIEKPSRDSSPIRRNLSTAGLVDNNLAPPLHNFNKRRPGSVRSARSAAASRETSPIRSISAAAAAVLRNSQQPDLQQPRPQRPLPNTSHWPSTSRLGLSRSPPSGSQSPAPSPLKWNEPTITPASLPPSRASLREKEVAVEDTEDSNPPSGMKTPRSNASPSLATVVESVLPNNPNQGASKSLSEQVAALVARQSNNTHTIHEESESEVSVETVKGRGSRAPSIAPSISSSIAHSLAESESESGYKSEDRSIHGTSRAPPPSKTFSRRPTVMGSDNFSGRMTVETETVTSVPQVALGAGVMPGGASIRSKKSTDTIRQPKKKDKKLLRKPGGAGNSNLTSKTDIFAAKIAEAVDEANSSDSEETFVYESNPPEPPTSHHRPRGFHHSRTPSATSIQGGPDPRGQRLPLLSSIDGNQSSRGKGMKFANTSNNSSNLGNEVPAGDGVGNERSAGSSSSRAGEAMMSGKDRENGNTRNQNGHRAILAEESPFHHHPSRKGSRHSLAGQHNSSKTSSHSSTPLNGSAYRNSNAQKRIPRAIQSYEADVEAGFDERAPLMSPTGRSGRRRDRDRPHRPNSGSLLQQDYIQQHRTRGCLRTYIGCIVAVAAVILIMTGVGGFLFATTKALLEVRVLNVTGVLVSKQEIMLDLVVEAINPNAIPVTVGNMDVNLFAKSSYVGDRKGKDGEEPGEGGGDGDGDGDGSGDGDGDADDGKRSWWGGRGRKGRTEEIIISQRGYSSQLSIRAHPNGNVDEGTDPPEDLPEGGDRQTMLLGRIYSFDSALTFEPSPLRHKTTISVGELRLAKPGNKTEEGGTERWERVLQHPFELIVRGVLRYQLPLSGRVRTAPIGASVIVHPDGLLKTNLKNNNEFHDDDIRTDK
ncbi:uncharacterized protein H6S33_005511 [Morchella sextelata]|uniref:uncharacterized protein n=1 Tax=Morchella sextelata TaxID=1174677 RepID=UPI001D0422CF|nr:uncharacterized protein H6S33_005511 [Morchella sextelata]KAH0613625.1 hypothetical protein H6S33_005511 [Morchella sextelata]